MLREDTVAYASLPQEEGVTPSSRFITSRSGPSTHNKRDFKLATILTVGVIVTGLGLAATLPFVLREKYQGGASDVDKDSDESGYDFFELSHLNGGDDFFATIDEPKTSPEEIAGFESTEMASPVPLQNIISSTIAREEPPVVVYPTVKPDNMPKPVKVTFGDENPTEIPDNFFSSADGNADADLLPDDSMLENPQPTDFDMNPAKEESSVPSVDAGEDLGNEAGETNLSPEDIHVDDEILAGNEDSEGSMASQEPDLGSLPATNIPETHNEKDSMDINQLLNEIYGEEGNPSSVSDTSYLDSIVSTRDKVTLVILAAVVAVALASVLAAVAWLIHSRIAQRRRRINIQNVITDLQSRDKIVLLNSESEEE